MHTSHHILDTSRGRTTFAILHHIFFFGLVAAGITFFGIVVYPFLAPLFWAIVFAITLSPLKERIERVAHTRVGVWTQMNGTLASLITLFVFLTCIIAPVSILGTIVTDEAVTFYNSLATDSIADQTVSLVTTQLAPLGIDAQETRAAITTYGKTLAGWVSAQALSFGTATLLTIVKTCIMLYLLFFLLRDGRRILAFVKYLLPIGHQREDTLFSTFTSITRAIFKGTIVVACIQSVIGGALFALAGVPHFLLATAVMFLFACIPGVGPALVWAPVGIALILIGNTFGGVLVLAGGGVIISLIDNILRPMLVGRDTALPDPIIFISILGGVASFGIAGVILGPVAAGVCLALLQMFADEYKEELDRH